MPGRSAGVTGMEGRHTVLLVEDEPQMASELGELLESLGHAHLHAATKEDAERLVEEGEFTLGVNLTSAEVPTQCQLRE